jgi:beta-galactosidase
LDAGEGQILAASNANQSEEMPFRITKMKAFNGRCQAIVQSTTQKGTITLTVKSEGLPGASIVINTK